LALLAFGLNLWAASEVVAFSRSIVRLVGDAAGVTAWAPHLPPLAILLGIGAAGLARARWLFPWSAPVALWLLAVGVAGVLPAESTSGGATVTVTGGLVLAARLAGAINLLLGAALLGGLGRWANARGRS
jgi:hypothetical protein